MGKQILYTGCVFISLFLFLLLLGKRRKTAVDFVLTLWIFFATIHLALIGCYASGNISKLPWLIGWEMPLPLLHGPFLYLYLLFLTGRPKHRARQLLHFAPALLCTLSLIPILASIPPEQRPDKKNWKPFLPYFEVLIIAFAISGIVYLLLSLQLLRRHKQQVLQQFSNTEKISLNWLRYLIGGMSVIWIIVIFYPSPQLLYLSVALFIFFLGYFGIRQTGIFTHQPESSTADSDVPVLIEQAQPATLSQEQEEPKAKYERTGLTEPTAIQIQEALKVLMQEQQLYADPELTLGDLAKALDVHPAILSQVINEKEQKSFYEYINLLRVETFKQLIQQPGNRQYTLLSLAFDCGFNSKSSFNRNFKKITGLSPSAYLKEHQITIVSE